MEKELALLKKTGVKLNTCPTGSSPSLRRDSAWNPKELSGKMLRIMDFQLFNPTMKARELGELVGLSQQSIRRIIRSDMYKTRYLQRRLQIEKLQNSQVVREQKKFKELRDRMIRKHEELVEMDPTQHGGKELDVQRIRQKSITELLKMSTEQLDRANGPGASRPENEDYEEKKMEVEIDYSDPNSAYVRMVQQWRKGTKG